MGRAYILQSLVLFCPHIGSFFVPDIWLSTPQQSNRDSSLGPKLITTICFVLILFYICNLVGFCFIIIWCDPVLWLVIIWPCAFFWAYTWVHVVFVLISINSVIKLWQRLPESQEKWKEKELNIVSLFTTWQRRWEKVLWREAQGDIWEPIQSVSFLI